MFTKQKLTKKYDDDFENFLAEDADSKLFTGVTRKKPEPDKPKYFWKDDDSDSSSIKLGTGKNFLKKNPTIIPVEDKSVEIESVHSDDLKLQLSDNTSTSKPNEREQRQWPMKDEGFPHPITFEGLTEPTIDVTKYKDHDKTIPTIDVTHFDQTQYDNDEIRESTNLEGTKDHLLSKVSLMDSNDYGKTATSMDYTNNKQPDFNSTLSQQHHNPMLDNKPPVFIPTVTSLNDEDDENSRGYTGTSGVETSNNPQHQSLDSFNYTQGMTNITDTMIGDTTAADLARLTSNREQRNQKPITNISLTTTDNSNNLEDPSRYRFRYNDEIESVEIDGTQDSPQGIYSKPQKSDLSDPISRSSPHSYDNSKADNSDRTTSAHDQTALPSPRKPRSSIKIANSEEKNRNFSYSPVRRSPSTTQQVTELNSANKRSRYSHIRSSGYGVKPVTPANRTTTANSKKQSVQKDNKHTHKSKNQRDTFITNKRPSSSPRTSKSRSYENNQYQNDMLGDTYQVDNRFTNNEPSSNVGRAREWQEKWLEERKITKKLQIDLDIQDRDSKKSQEAIIKKYEEKIRGLENQLNMQQKRPKLDIQNYQLKDGITKEHVMKLEKEIEQQEHLITGYQKDNQRLYEEIKQLKVEKSHGKVDNSENDRLISQIVSLQSDLETKNIQIDNMKGMLQKTHARENEAAVGFHEDEIAYLKEELKSMGQKLYSSQSENQKLTSKMEKLESESEKLISQYQKELEIVKIEKEKLKDSHKYEVDDLKKKIKWYLENQAILNKESKRLKQKEDEISDLRRQLESSENPKISSQIRQKERTSELGRIKSLEEENLSLKSELYAVMKDKNIGNIGTKRSFQFLEEKIQRLERDKDDQIEKEQKNLRSMEQQVEILKSQYEDRIKDLELDLIGRLGNKSMRHEKEVRITELNSKIGELTKKLAQKDEQKTKLMKELQNNKNQQQTKSAVKKPFNIRRIDTNSADMDSLKKEMRLKEKELERLKLENSYLKTVHDDRKSYTEQMNFNNQNPNVLHLQDQLVHISGELEKAHAQLEQERNDRINIEQRMRNEYKLELDQNNNFHQDQLRNVKLDFLNRHSESDIPSLKSQLDLQKNFIAHLKQQLDEANTKTDKQSNLQQQLQEANSEVDRLKSELKDLRVIWSNKPGLEMIERLRSKIYDLEQKEVMKEKVLEDYVTKAVNTRTDQIEDENSKLKSQLSQRTQKMFQIQHELNQLLDSLEELRRQGITIPKSNNKPTFPYT